MPELNVIVSFVKQFHLQYNDKMCKDYAHCHYRRYKSNTKIFYFKDGFHTPFNISVYGHCILMMIMDRSQNSNNNRHAIRQNITGSFEQKGATV